MKSQDEREIDWLLKEKHNGEKTEAFYTDCKALALGTPLGYLIGHAPFLDCTIHLDNHPLIPRVETEFWVEQAIEVIRDRVSQPRLFTRASPAEIEQTSRKTFSPKSLSGELDSCLSNSRRNSEPVHILDLCAGSGCIGVAVGKQLPAARIDFAELNQRLLLTIKKNCEVNGLDLHHYNMYHSNLFAQLPADNTYDFILSNPPYIDPVVDRAEASVKCHEPHLALYGGVGGMEIIEQLITAAPNHLTTGGQLWIEHEPEQSIAVQTIAELSNFKASSHVDQYSIERYSILVLQ